MSYQNSISKNNSSFLYNLDFFGEKIIFTFNGKSTMKTTVGLIFTVFLAFIGIAMFMFMGQGFLFKVDPTSTYSLTSLETVQFLNTTNSKNMFVAFRVKQGSSVLKVDGSYFTFVITQLRLLNITNSRKYLPITECSKTVGIDKRYLRKAGLEGNYFYCLPLNFEDFGGPPSNTNYNYLEVLLSACDSTLDPKCKKPLADSFNKGTTPLYVETYYPQIYFDPNNVDNPLTVSHSLVTDKYQLSGLIAREIQLKKSVFYDDDGWLLRHEKITNVTSVHSTISNKLNKDATSLQIYNLNIFAGSLFETYTRKYQKLQDVIAVVGGFLKMCQIVFELVLFYYNKYVKGMLLINGLVDWNENGSQASDNQYRLKIQALTEEITKLQPFNSNLPTVSPTQRKESKRKNTKNNDITPNNAPQPENTLIKFSNNNLSYNISNNKSMPSSPGLKHADPKCNFSQFELINMNDKKQGIDKLASRMDLNKKEAKKEAKKNSYLFKLTCLEVIQKACCRGFLSGRSTKKVLVFDIANNYVKQMLDVFGYLDLVTDVNNIKSAIFNNAQKSCFNFHRRPFFNVKDEIDENEITAFQNRLLNKPEDLPTEQKKIVEYYAYNFYKNTANRVDTSLLNQLDDNTLNLISQKLEYIKDMVSKNRQPDFDPNYIKIDNESTD
jgi:hypothetical protein